MQTLFSMGFSRSPFFSGPSLGQQTLSSAEKADLYDRLVTAESVLDVVDAWKKNHPNAAADLGADAQRFQELYASVIQLKPVADDLIKRTLGTAPAVLTFAELDQAENWMAYIQQLFLITTNHTGKPPAPSASGAPVPASGSAVPAAAASPEGVSPLAVGLIGVGVLTLLLVAFK